MIECRHTHSSCLSHTLTFKGLVHGKLSITRATSGGVEYAVCRPKDKPKALKRDSIYNIDMLF